MIIRPAQFNSLTATMRQRFAQTLAAHLRERFTARLAEVSDAALVAFASRGIDKAAGYGIRADYDVRRYTEYMVEFGPDFDVKLTWAARILDGNETAAEKMDGLDAFTIFELRRRRQ